MKNRDKVNKILPVVLIILVVIIAVLAIVSLGKVILRSSNGSKTKVVDVSRETLLNTSLSHAVRMTVRGPIVADENFRSYQVVITPEKRTLTSYKGYLDEKIDGVTLDNNVKAYEELVYSLDKANYTKGVAFAEDKDDTRGICATGVVTEFDVLKDNQSVKHLWTSTCKGSPGSLKAYEPQLRALFLKQIPDSGKLLPKFGTSL